MVFALLTLAEHLDTVILVSGQHLLGCLDSLAIELFDIGHQYRQVRPALALVRYRICQSPTLLGFIVELRHHTAAGGEDAGELSEVHSSQTTRVTGCFYTLICIV